MIKAKYTFRDFLPLITLIGLLVLFSVVITRYSGGGFMFGMQIFMGGFFVVFGLLKVVKLKAFVEAYQMYDLVAKRSKIYAYVYPFVELGLGLMYLVGIFLIAANIVTIILMSVSAIGVYKKLQKHEVVMCACLGTVFKVPMTWVTLAENVLMAGMAIAMLVT